MMSVLFISSLFERLAVEIIHCFTICFHPFPLLLGAFELLFVIFSVWLQLTMVIITKRKEKRFVAVIYGYYYKVKEYPMWFTYLIHTNIYQPKTVFNFIHVACCVQLIHFSSFFFGEHFSCRKNQHLQLRAVLFVINHDIFIRSSNKTRNNKNERVGISLIETNKKMHSIRANCSISRGPHTIIKLSNFIFVSFRFT